jgi:hypothetical protein
VEKYGTTTQAIDDNIIRRMRFACWITKATYTICNTYCSPWQQWLRERASVLPFYVNCLSCYFYIRLSESLTMFLLDFLKFLSFSLVERIESPYIRSRLNSRLVR